VLTRTILLRVLISAHDLAPVVLTCRMRIERMQGAVLPGLGTFYAAAQSQFKQSEYSPSFYLQERTFRGISQEAPRAASARPFVRPGALLTTMHWRRALAVTPQRLVQERVPQHSLTTTSSVRIFHSIEQLYNGSCGSCCPSWPQASLATMCYRCASVHANQHGDHS